MFGMMFKMTFWGGLVLLFLPLDTGAANGGRNVSPLEAVLAARETVADIRGICQRKPEVCVTGEAALETIKERAKVGARMALEYIDESKKPAVATN